MNKKLKTALVILIMVLVALVSFMGLYIKDKNKYSNKVKEYQLGMDLKGSRKVELELSTEKETVNYDSEGNKIKSSDTTTEVAKTEEVPVNEQSSLTADNYKLTKKILEKRLKTLGVNNYTTRLDEKTGKIVLNIPENDSTDSVVGQLQYQGKFEIIDKDTEEVLMTNKDIESVKAGYGSNSSSTTVIFINIQFNKEGTQKFKDITNTYIQTTEAVEENPEGTEVTDENETSENETKTVTKEISLKIDGSTILSTHFEKEISNGLLQLSVGSTSSDASAEELQESLKSANNIAALLDNGQYPLTYKTASNQFIASEITNQNVALFICLCIVANLIAMICIIIKYKDDGIFAPVYLISYIAILLLLIRYTNVIVTIPGLIAIVISIVLSYIAMINKIENNIKEDNKKDAYKKSLKQNLLMFIPIAIIAIVFTFNSYLPVSSFGMVLFWGLIVDLIYMI